MCAEVEVCLHFALPRALPVVVRALEFKEGGPAATKEESEDGPDVELVFC